MEYHLTGVVYPAPPGRKVEAGQGDTHRHWNEERYSKELDIQLRIENIGDLRNAIFMLRDVAGGHGRAGRAANF
jgi:hypothetical protein